MLLLQRGGDAAANLMWCILGYILTVLHVCLFMESEPQTYIE